MLPGPRLLLRAALLLGTARCSPAAPDSEWSTPGTPGHPSMTRTLLAEHQAARAWGPPARTSEDEGLMVEYYRLRSKELYPADSKKILNRSRLIPTDPNRRDLPSEPNRTNHPSEPNRTGTDPPSEPNRTGTDPPSEPNRTGTNPPSEPKSTETPSEPNRTGTDLTLEPKRTDPSSQPKRIGAEPPSEPNRTRTNPPSETKSTETELPSEPNRTGTDLTLEPNRTGTDIPLEPNRTGTDLTLEPKRIGAETPSEPKSTGSDVTSQPSRTGTDIQSEPNRTGTEHPSEPNRTVTDLPLEPNRTEFPSQPNRTDPPSEPNRTGTDLPSEPNRTGTDPPSEPNRTGTDPPSEPNRTGTDLPLEPNRTGTDPPSEPNRTEPSSEPNRTGTPSEPNRTGTPSLSADIGRTQTLAELNTTEHHLGPHLYYRSELDWTEMDMAQTYSAARVTQKSATQRHLNKRTPQMDTTYISSTGGGDRTLLSISKDGNVSDITEMPHTYPTNTVSHKSENISEETATTARGNGNATDEIRNMFSPAAASVPGTYPLQTPAYVVTTYPSPTSHQMPDSTIPFTSVPSTRSSPKTTGVTPNNTSIDLWSSSPSTVGSSSSSSSSSLSTVSTSVAASSSPPDDVTQQSQQPPWRVSSSSPTSSTLGSPARSSVSPPLTTKTPHPLTATSSTTESLASSTSLLPSYNTESTPDNGAENKTLVSFISPTDETSTASNTSMAVSPETPRVVTERRPHDETTTQDVTTRLQPTEAQTTAMSTSEEGTLRVTVGTRLIATSTQTMVSAPSTTSSHSPPTPSPYDTTQQTPRDAMSTAWPVSSASTPTDQKVVTERTTRIYVNTETPRPEPTASTKGKKTFSHPPPPSTTAAVRYAASTAVTATRPRSPPTAAAGPCSSSPCHNGGLCVESQDLKSYRCDCPAAWSGHLCSTDVDECLSGPCPAPSTCLNSRGSYSCRCPLGYLLQTAAGCVLVRTFLGRIEIPWSLLDGFDVKDSTLHQIKEDIVHVLNSSFSTISGYYQSTVASNSHTSSNDLIVQNLFSLESNVTMFDLSRSLQNYAKVCKTSRERPTSCELALHLQHRIRALSLCRVRSPGCDNETAVCADPAGVALCQCNPGFFKYSKTDHSCRACDDGYKLENGACVRCPFGFGGFNCSNPYQLITVIIAAGGGGLLLILVVALAVTCCRKSKHDISKLIFKSGDFQMSPYAEYPKTQRSSEWGRETIEMQENGSTKNLLQMTDVYYSPGLRNSEIERNGLYPYSGLPGSRHSCIYPGQYNPSFINEENRRRDYF